jgi:glycosyltransferase involved in cell wall biosynthesis
VSRKPRPILYVHHRPELGGAPQSLAFLIEKLDRARFEPHVYCPSGLAASAFERAGAVVHTGPISTFTHIWASTYNGRRWLLFGRELSRLPLHAVTFTRVLKRRPYALVHLNDSPLLPAAAMVHRERIPIVWHLRSALPGDGDDLRSSLIRGAIRKFAAASIAINADVARSFDVGAHVIPNGVNLEQFRPAVQNEARAALGLDGRPIVAYFGFIYPSKGFRDFIESARLLRRSGTTATYLIVGGPVRGEEFFHTSFGRLLRAAGLTHDHQHEAETLVRDLGMEDCIRFIPYTDDAARIFQATDVVVAPSRGPELARPVLEAAACGRAVVTSGSIDGAGIVLPDETGLLVPRRSPDSLAAALAQLLGDAAARRRLGETARRFAEENFDTGRNAERIMDLYDELLATP